MHIDDYGGVGVTGCVQTGNRSTVYVVNFNNVSVLRLLGVTLVNEILILTGFYLVE